MREVWLQMWHDIHPNAKSQFVTKGHQISFGGLAFSFYLLLDQAK